MGRARPAAGRVDRYARTGPEPATVTLDQLLTEAVEQWITARRTAGGEPEAELTAARLGHDRSPIDHVIDDMWADGQPDTLTVFLDTGTAPDWQWALAAHWVEREHEYTTAVWLATRSNCPAAVLDGLADTWNNQLADAVAAHPHTPDPALVRMIERGMGAARIAARPEITRELAVRLAKGSLDECAALAANPACPAGLRDELARDPRPSVRTGAARNPRLDPTILDRLAREGGSGVRDALLGNPTVTADTIDYLATEGDEVHRQRATVHPNVRDDTLDRLTRDPVRTVARAAHEALAARRPPAN